MLKFYHAPLSFNSRRVWVALIEKEIPFEDIRFNLEGEQFQPDYLAINPFHHIPAVVDDGFNVIESLAILDYLEAKYPTPALLPTDPKSLGVVRMVEMVTINELVPAMAPLLRQMMGFGTADAQQQEKSNERIAKVLTFLENLLGDRTYFSDQHLTLAEVVAGTTLPVLSPLGIPLVNYPKVSGWYERLAQRESWKKTELTPEEMAAAMSRLKARRAH